MEAEVPEEWSLERLGALGSLQKSRGGPKRDGVPRGVPVIRYGELYTHHHDVIREFHSFIPPERTEDYTSLEEGDVLFAGAGETADEIGKSAVFLGPEPAYGSGDMIIFRPDDRVDPLFFGYASNGRVANQHKVSVGQGSSIIHIYADDLESLELPLPPLPEQKKIAAILSSVDDAIAKTRKVIEQTKRVNKGLLQDLMTRGIGHTRFKQTEIGKIPEEWEVSTLEYLIDSITDYRGKTPPYTDEGIPVISAANVSDGEVHGISNYVTEETFEKWTTRGLQEPGDVLFTTEAPVAEVARVPVDRQYLITRRIVALTPRAEINKDFVFWYMLRLSQKGFWERLMHGSTVPRILKPDLMRTKIPVPSRHEQDAISERLESVLTCEKRLRDLVPVLSCLKRGLMQDLLTGRVRVPVD